MSREIILNREYKCSATAGGMNIEIKGTYLPDDLTDIEAVLELVLKQIRRAADSSGQQEDEHE